MQEIDNYDFVCEESDIKELEGQRFYINDTDIAVFKVEGKIYVVSNTCPHQHAPNIYEGFVENKCVVCPLHGWTFHLDTGNLHSGSRGLETYPIKIIDGKIYAKVVYKELNW